MSSLFHKFALGFYGCDGGDLGSPSNKSIWACGIEWGGREDPATMEDFFRDEYKAEEYSKSCPVYERWQHNLEYNYNWQLMKILSAIAGGNVGEYKKFAEEIKPFTKGSAGYFKMNLYPLAFKDTSHEHWTEKLYKVTGFETKPQYIEWVQKNRFPVIRSWTEKYSPKLVLCTGITYKHEFYQAFGVNDPSRMKEEIIDERSLAYGVNKQGTLVAVIPFMVGSPYGLLKNTSIQKFGQRIRELLSL